MSEATVYGDGVYKLKDLGIWSLETKEGAVAARAVQIKKRTGVHEQTHMTFLTDKLESGKAKLGDLDVYVLPGELPETEMKPAYEIFNRPAEGMLATSAGAVPALYGVFTGNPLLALAGAAVIGSYGFLNYIPHLTKRAYSKAKTMVDYAKGKTGYYSDGQKWLLDNAAKIVGDYEGLINPAPEEAAA